ncbi:MAG: orotidine-5'-phosphate decarboxylase [Fimbriimonadales bacterium]
MPEAVLQRVILALDTPDLGQACAWVRQYAPQVHAFKIGGALVLEHGLSVIEPLRQHGAERVFLDLKFHDIPHAVQLAVRTAAEHGVWMLTLHTSGGEAMMRAAVEAVAGLSHRPLLMGVTVLTSLDKPTLQAIGVPRSPRAQVQRLAHLAHQCGLDGVIASPLEIRLLRRHLPPPFLIVTPGIRPRGADTGDQRRTATPDQALRWGADYLVMGRAILGENEKLP